MLTLAGSCRCGAVRFSMQSHAPHPYQLCYCTICRKTAGGGGFAINLSAAADSLDVKGRAAPALISGRSQRRSGRQHTSSGERNFCGKCDSRSGCSIRPGRISSIHSHRPWTRASDPSVAHAHHAAFQGQLGGA